MTRQGERSINVIDRMANRDVVAVLLATTSTTGEMMTRRKGHTTKQHVTHSSGLEKGFTMAHFPAGHTAGAASQMTIAEA